MRSTLLCLGLLVGSMSWGQSGKHSVTLYAYCRESTPGAHIGFAHEKGEENTINPSPRLRSWFFYVEVPAGANIKPLYLVLHQQKFTLTVEPEKHTPVIFERPGILNQVEKDTLVPKSSQKVYRLLPVSLSAVTAENPTAQLVYSIHKKIKKTPVQPIRLLPPLVLE